MPSHETVLAGGTSTSLMENKGLGEPVVLRITLSLLTGPVGWEGRLFTLRYIHRNLALC